MSSIIAIATKHTYRYELFDDGTYTIYDGERVMGNNNTKWRWYESRLQFQSNYSRTWHDWNINSGVVRELIAQICVHRLLTEEEV